MSIDHAEIKDRFHLELGRMVHAHSLFDFNIGIALGWMSSHFGEDKSDLLEAKVPLTHRLEALNPLMLKMYEPAGKEAAAEIKGWFSRACALKAIRNNYVHARWGIPGQSGTDDPVLKMLPMNWNFQSDGPDKSVDVSLSILAEQRASIEKLSEQFFKLQRDYAPLAVRAIPAAE